MLSHANVFILLVLLKTLIGICLGENGIRQFDGQTNLTTATANYTLTQMKDVRNTVAAAAAATVTTNTVENLPRPERLDAAPIDLGKLPEFPKRTDAVYFIVAVAGGAKIWARTLARTLIDMGTPFGSPQGPPLRPLYVDIPQNGRYVLDELTVERKTIFWTIFPLQVFG